MEKRETKADQEFTRFKPRKTIRLGTPSVSGRLITCPHCKTVTHAGTIKDGECPFCYKQINGRRS